MEEGFDLFYEIPQGDLENRSPLRIVTALEAKLWRDRLNANKPVEPEADLQGEAVIDVGLDGVEKVICEAIARFRDCKG